MTEAEKKAEEIYKKFWRKTPQPYKTDKVIIDGGKELKFNEWDRNWTDRMAKECALIYCNGMIEELKDIQDKEHSDYYFTMERYILDWQEVKQIIETKY